MATRFDRALSDAHVQLVHARRVATLGKPHVHAEAMIFVPLSGSLAFAIAGATRIADAQHALVVRGGTEHRHAPSEGVEYAIAYVDDRALAARLPDARRNELAFRFANTALVRELAGELLELAAATPRDGDAIAAATLLLVVQATRGHAIADPHAPLPDDDRLARAIELARTRYRDGISTAELAAAARMSPRSFERALLRACGTTPRRLVEELRLAEAKARLAAGRETVTAVAYDLGYKSLSHFVRRFRATFGVTPTAVSRKG
ncbi:MAG TPA: AraC family transcriptional regulator [Kofleriaceae bacterium]|nr:AraC family transcriptional regulator [Kofleriaceae bacterium]